MKKTIFYISSIIFLYSAYSFIDFIALHSKNMNDYENGYLIGKIILLAVFGLLIFKTYPYRKKDKGND